MASLDDYLSAEFDKVANDDSLDRLQQLKSGFDFSFGNKQAQDSVKSNLDMDAILAMVTAAKSNAQDVKAQYGITGKTADYGMPVQPPMPNYFPEEEPEAELSNEPPKMNSTYPLIKQDFIDQIPGIYGESIVGGITKSAAYGLGDPINNARMKAGMRPISSNSEENKKLNDLWNTYQVNQPKLDPTTQYYGRNVQSTASNLF